MLNSIKIPLRVLHKLEDGLLLSIVLLLIGLSLTQILLRNAMDSGLVWADPALRILELWVAMVGAMRASRDRAHIAIDILRRYFKGPVRYLATWFSLIAAAGICAIASYYSFEFIQLEREDSAIAFLSIPVWYCEAIIPFALGIMALRFLYQSLMLIFGKE